MKTTCTLEFTPQEWEEIDSLASGLIEIKADMPRTHWIAIGNMALGKAQRLEEGAYGPDDDGCDSERWAEELRAIAAIIFDTFQPGDGRV